jgi:hypothetical protein
MSPGFVFWSLWLIPTGKRLASSGSFGSDIVVAELDAAFAGVRGLVGVDPAGWVLGVLHGPVSSGVCAGAFLETAEAAIVEIMVSMIAIFFFLTVVVLKTTIQGIMRTNGHHSEVSRKIV